MDAFKLDQCLINKTKLKASFEDKTIELPDKIISLLFILAEAKNQTVTRQFLLETLWSGSIVSDDSLTNLVSVTRAKFKQLGIIGVIKTVPKKGYCLVGEIYPLETTSIKKSQDSLKPTQKKRFPFWLLATIGFIAILFILISANKPKDTLTLAILPVGLDKVNHSIQQYVNGFEQELQQKAVNNESLQVLSRNQVKTLWQNTPNLKQLKEILGADYVIESQIREQDHYLRLTLQFVNTATAKALHSDEFDVAISLLTDNRSEVWQQISQLFIQNTLYSLGIYSASKALSANQLCTDYLSYLKFYSGSYLENVAQIARKGQDACSQAIELNPDNSDTYRNTILLYIALAQSEKRDMEQRTLYLDKGEQVLVALSSLPNTELLYAESITELIFLRILGNTRNLDIDALFNQAENVIRKHEKSGNISATLAKNGAVLRHHQARHLHRTGKNPDQVIINAIELIDKGLTLDVDDTSLIHSKARVYKTWASITSTKGDDPSTMLNHAIALYKRMIELAPKQPAGYDALANAYSSLAKWKARKNQSYEQEFNAAIQAYNNAIAVAPSHHFTYNNMADLYAGIIVTGTYSEAQFQAYTLKGIQLANTAIKIKSEYVWAMFNLAHLNLIKAQLSYATNNYDDLPVIECEQHFSNGLILKPNISEAIAQLAECKLYAAKQHLAQGHLVDAQVKMQDVNNTISRALGANPNLYLSLALSADAKIISSLIAKAHGKTEQLIKQLELAITLAQKAIQEKKDEQYSYLVLIRASWLKQLLFPTNENSQAVDDAFNLYKQKFANDKRVQQLSVRLKINTALLSISPDDFKNYRDFISAKELEANYNLTFQTLTH